MVQDQLRACGITDERVLDAMCRIPRERFVPQRLITQAYCDSPLPIGSGQTISQPHVVALMTQALKLQSNDTVLEIGTGSGYAAAVLSLLCKKVYSIERIKLLAQRATNVLSELEFTNVEVITGDGTKGWPKAAPYSGIVITAGGPQIPQSLVSQLAINGRLVMPIGESSHDQKLIVAKRINSTELQLTRLCDVRFVPLIGAESWSRENLTS